MWFSLLFSFVISGLFLMSAAVLSLLKQRWEGFRCFQPVPRHSATEEMGVRGGIWCSASSSWKLCSPFQPFTPCRNTKFLSSPLPERPQLGLPMLPPLHPRALSSEKALRCCWPCSTQDLSAAAFLRAQLAQLAPALSSWRHQVLFLGWRKEGDTNNCPILSFHSLWILPHFMGILGITECERAQSLAGWLTAFKPSLPDWVIATCTQVMLPAQDNEISF